MSEQKRIVICGGGIIGCSTAFYLAKLGQTNITIVDRHEIAGQASGKAGGFLALDWNDGGPVGALARRSFQLHEELSREFSPFDVGYRKMQTFSVRANETDESGPRLGTDVLPQWIDARVRGVESLGNFSTTAQVHPHKLVHAMVDFITSKGGKIVIGNVDKVSYNDDQQVTGVVVAGQTIEADVVVIAMGPWSGLAANYFPGSGLPQISGTRAHSIIYALQEKKIGPDAIFLSYSDSENKLTDPEIYPRGDGTVYICGQSDQCPLPADPQNVTFDVNACNKLASIVSHMSSTIKNHAKVICQQACYLPCSPDGYPLIGKVPGYRGAFIATGHSCWGILNGPATGESLAQMILGLQTSVSLERLLPGRFLKVH